MHSCNGPIRGNVSHIIVTGGGSSKDYELPIASNTTLGGVKISEDLTISEDGVIYINICANSGQGQYLFVAFGKFTAILGHNEPGGLF